MVSAVLIVIVALVVVAALAVLARRFLGLEPGWLASARHAIAEARYRSGGVLAELGDFIRMGR